MQDDDKQMLRVQAIEGNRIIANLLLQGVGLSTARIPLKTSSSVKVRCKEIDNANSALYIQLTVSTQDMQNLRTIRNLEENIKN